MTDKAPIVLFVYCRPFHTKICVEGLARNNGAKETELFVFADFAKRQEQIEDMKLVREYIHSVEERHWFKNVHIIEERQNKGLASSIIDGVSSVIEKYGKVIVVEDDLNTSAHFLDYMNGALDYYQKDETVGSISAYTYPIRAMKKYPEDVYACYKGECWGWATWKDRWNGTDWDVRDYADFKKNRRARKAFDRLEIDLSKMMDGQMNGTIDSWAVRWVYSLHKRNLKTIYPRKSFVANIGFDGTGTHCAKTERCEQDSYEGYEITADTFSKVEPQKQICKQVCIYWTGNWFKRMWTKIKRRLMKNGN